MLKKLYHDLVAFATDFLFFERDNVSIQKINMKKIYQKIKGGNVK